LGSGTEPIDDAAAGRDGRTRKLHEARIAQPSPGATSSADVERARGMRQIRALTAAMSGRFATPIAGRG